MSEATRWEYRVISEERDSIDYASRQRGPIALRDSPLESKLNELGLEGWELVATEPTDRGAGFGIRFIFKRPKAE